MAFLRLYVKNQAVSSCSQWRERINDNIKTASACVIDSLETEFCYYVKTSALLNKNEMKILSWILLQPFDKTVLEEKPNLTEQDFCETTLLVEIGPRLSFSTPFCTNAVSICHNAGLKMISKIEKSTRYLLKSSQPITEDVASMIVKHLHDPMTQARYMSPLKTFETCHKRLSWSEIDVMNEGEEALKRANRELGLAMDDQDIKLYTELFQKKLKKNPTTVECFDLAQSNSEHSRHWYFNGKMTIDGRPKPTTMFQNVKNTQLHSNRNNVIAFRDNSSAIKGFEIDALVPNEPGRLCPMKIEKPMRHIALTAETHNFPTGVAPFPGATTGTGGRQRDQHAAGRGSHIVAGTAGYCVGNLNLPHHPLAWEDGGKWKVPGNLAPAARIAIEASDGASDYGNKFGEPVITGFFRSFGMKLPDGERREWLKPIMFSGGIGSIEAIHVDKIELDKDPLKVKDLVVGKIGGPSYCIGVGGGAASSLVLGDNSKERDFNAVQRGDAQMQQKLNRVVRACVEMKNKNPILSIHDQGAGGNGNVLKEIVEPAGAVIRADAFSRGDVAMTTLELWVAEYQESDAVLLHRNQVQTVKDICERERSTLDVVGELTGDGRIVLSEQETRDATQVRHPVDLELECVLGKMKPKEYDLVTLQSHLQPLTLPDVSIKEMIMRVLQLPSVGSKRFLTNKVDRSVGGLIAQQQCVGPLHTPLADVAVTALSHFSQKGSATAVGEQPVKMLVDPCAGARLTVGEALTNLVFAAVSDLRDVKCSANWMWPAKLPGEGASIYATCEAMCGVMKELGIAVDGGKDSLSMAARIDGETVKCPGSLVVSVYAPCPDVSLKITPDLKCYGDGSSLVYVPLSKSPGYLGGSALAHCYGQIGDKIPNLDDSELFVNAWNMTQQLIRERKVVSGHDVSDGGLVTCLLEMAFAGNFGLKVDVQTKESTLAALFSERLGLVLETTFPDEVLERYKACGVDAARIGESRKERKIFISVNGAPVLEEELTSTLRDVWESTSFALEKLQCNADCVNQERKWLLECDREPPFHIGFDVVNEAKLLNGVNSPAVRVAVLREEGSNGDREMCAAFVKAGFEAWDVTMQDLLKGDVTLDRFQGLVFVGGFSYADVLGSAKGWAACSLFNERLRKQLDTFYRRNDTFSLGVCNGCQLMAYLGWVGGSQRKQLADESFAPDMSCFLGHNKSGRFESRFVTVRILDSPSIMLKGMAGSRLGVWIAHGEGCFQYKNEAVLNALEQDELIPLCYVDNRGDATTGYPFNPNGSEKGVAGLCSFDGRHLAVMPHPERTVEMWHFPWSPQSWQGKVTASPWNKMFTNAMEWCLQQNH